MMGDETQEIKVVGIDKEAIQLSADGKDLWVVPFKLSQKPDQSWERKFYEIQEKDKNAMKRKARVVDNYIRVEIAGSDNLQNVLDVVKAEIVDTNVLWDADYQKKMKVRRDLEDLQQRQTTAVNKLKADSDNLVF
jgi:hypothetical protein